jgi:hypothetical protein
MLQTLKELLGNQYEAALCTLAHCIDRCDDSAWNAPVGSLAFCQVAFHTLFFTDFYLGENESGIREQPFHRDRPDFFRDYEELQPRVQTLHYNRSDVLDYLQHCRRKAAETLARESADELSSRSGFPGRTFSRAELHLYNIRHIQHHAAQLSLRLRLDSGQDIPWIGSGWRDPARTAS